jgi:1-acyl-sn-glycerol-3-phosphate acyltransferase
LYNTAAEMKKILGYILSPIYLIVFGALLGIFHPIQVICWNVWGYPAQKRAAEIMCYLIVRSLIILGSRVKFKGFEKLPQNCPLIIVSNHQSQYDIPPIVWGFRKYYPKFISKIELGKGIPSISYNLRKGGSALIDRKKPSQSIKTIIKLGRQIEAKNYSACIFPEGTRSKDGKVRTFKVSGLGTLLKTSPSAAVIPFAVNGNYLLQRFPMGVGEELTYSVLDPIERETHSAEEISEMCELAIKKELGQI